MKLLQLTLSVCALVVTFPLSNTAQAENRSEIAQLRAEIAQLQQHYEKRIRSLEERLQRAESAPVAPTSSVGAANTASITPTPSASSTSQNAFNPAISLILSGLYTQRSNAPQNATDRISGFQAGGEIGAGARGFSLSESELNLYASIDPYFYGALNLALNPDNTASVEEAFVQTTALPHNVSLKAGRFYSGIGYLNEQHAHTWDFVDSPLVYQTFLGGQFNDDGVQVKWLAPTELFLELGAGAGRGNLAGAEGRNKNGSGSGTLFGHIGGDIGSNHSWRAGLSYLRAGVNERQSQDIDASGSALTNSFTGKSRIVGADLVWKWAPNGNDRKTNVKLQAEYFQRKESGLINSDNYAATQAGGYAQLVYQFMPRWRTGLRYDRLKTEHIDYGVNSSDIATEAMSYSPQRLSWMIDYSFSEFSRLRLQLARDQSRQGAPDNQIFLQYQMNLGAHGAHNY